MSLDSVSTVQRDQYQLTYSSTHHRRHNLRQRNRLRLLPEPRELTHAAAPRDREARPSPLSQSSLFPSPSQHPFNKTPTNPTNPTKQDQRTRLSLHTEHFLDTTTHKPPKDYKPTKPAEASHRDKTYQIETHTRLSESLSTLLHNPATPPKLTPHEQKYFTLIATLSTLLRTALETPKSASTPAPATFTTAVSTTRAILEGLRADFFDGTPPKMASLPGGEGDVLHHLLNPLGLSTLRDAALTVRWASGSLVSFHADQTARDRSGRSGLHKEVLSEAKGLDEAAGRVLGAVRARVKELREVLGLGGWLDRMEGWAFADGGEGVSDVVREVVGEADVEEWGGRVVESWREGVKGFAMGRME